MKSIDNEKIKIRPAEEKDYPIILDLCDRRFGKGYIDHDEFSRWLCYPDFFLALDYDGEFVGYVCILPSDPDEVCRKTALPIDEVRAECENKKVIRCRSAVLREEFERCGFMRMLWEKVFANAKAAGYDIAYCPAWKYDGFVPMDHLLTKLGFFAVAEKEMLWYDEENYTCVVCNGRCRCTARVYKMYI